MSKWGKLGGLLQLGATIAGAFGLKIKGIPIGTIASEAETVVGSVKRVKAAKPPKPKKVSGSPGD